MRFLIIIAIFSFFCIGLFADTTVPAGTVTGNWTAAGSPYQVMGDINIPSGSVLSVGPGVEVIFNGTYKLDVLGQIVCIGEEANEITFTAQDTLNGWQAIRFTNTGTGVNQPSLFDYTSFYYGKAVHGPTSMDPLNFGGAVWANNGGTLTFNNCAFRRCTSAQDGSAIYANNNTVINMSNCSVKDCDSGFWGGVFVKTGAANIQNCTFQSNNANVFGGALYLYNLTSANVTSCQIINSSAGACAGIYSYGSPLVVTNCLFKGNSTVTGSGGGMGVISGSLTVTNCTFTENSSPMGGGAFWINVVPTPAIVTNTIFWNNTPNAIANASSTYNLNYCSMQVEEGNETNIWGDPLFTNPALSDFTLQFTSPCVDSGTPDTAGLNLPLTDLAGLSRIMDGDGDSVARIDMGCYERPAPVTTGEISGQVTDNMNQPLAGATITVDTMSSVTDANGFYTITLDPGIYSVTCSMDGYYEITQDNIEVVIGQTTTVNFNLSPVSNADQSNLSAVIMLKNHPNPFINTTTISFSLVKTSPVRLEIYNLKGQKVKSLVNENMKSGYYNISWNGTDESNLQVGTGIYLCRLVSGKEILTKRLMKL